MGIFSNSSPFDQDVERATSENSTTEEWGLMMEICDRAGASAGAARDCLRAVLRRLQHADPHVQCLAATLLDACVSNCGRAFRLEVASRDFLAEFRRALQRAQPPVQARLRALVRKWAEGDFRDDPALDLIPSLHRQLRAEDPAPSPAPAPAAPAAAAQRERDELARAIALSLREAAPLYPRVEEAAAAPDPAPAPAPAPARRVRALYDFEAAEDNELTFKAGETVHVTDCSDPNWWKGYNARGEGLFPANFVSEEPEPAAAPAPAAEPEPAPAAVDEAAMDAALAALHDADPAAPGEPRAEAELARLEARALAAGPLVDAALERADTRHARLTQLSAELVDALNLYHELMRPPRGQLAGPPMAVPPMAGPPLAGPPMAGPPMSGPPLAGPPLGAPHPSLHHHQAMPR